jgi:hypothetical protein
MMKGGILVPIKMDLREQYEQFMHRRRLDMIFGKNYAMGAVSVPLPLCVCVCFCVCVNVLLFRSVTYWPTFSPFRQSIPLAMI